MDSVYIKVPIKDELPPLGNVLVIAQSYTDDTIPIRAINHGERYIMVYHGDGDHTNITGFVDSWIKEVNLPTEEDIVEESWHLSFDLEIQEAHTKGANFILDHIKKGGAE